MSTTTHASTITAESIQALGQEKVARFAGCIYINYLFHMNGGGHGYKADSIQKMKKSEEDRVNKNFIAYTESVAKAIAENNPQTITETWFLKAYTEWYSTK